MLLAARHEDGSPMSPAELRDELMTLLVAGHETTASELGWAFERLAREPAVLSRLVEEIAEGDGDAYLTATIHETLRRRPVLPNAAPRLVKKPVEIGGWTYPAGVCVVANAYLIQHDPDIYEDPYAFRPERFLDSAARDLYLDPVWRRPAALPRGKLRHGGDEDRAASGAGALPARSRRGSRRPGGGASRFTPGRGATAVLREREPVAAGRASAVGEPALSSA